MEKTIPLPPPQTSAPSAAVTPTHMLQVEGSYPAGQWRSRGTSAWTPFVTKAGQTGVQADSEGRWRRRLSGAEGFSTQRASFPGRDHIWLKPEPGSPLPRKTPSVLPTDGKWARAVRNEPKGLLAPARTSILVLSRMRTVVGGGRRRQLGRVFSLGRNSLPLLGLGNVRICHVSKNTAKGSVLFDPRVGRGRKLTHKRAFYVLSVVYSPLLNSHPPDAVNILYTSGTVGLVRVPRVLM